MIILVRLIGPSLIALSMAAGAMLWSPAPEARAIGPVPCALAQDVGPCAHAES